MRIVGIDCAVAPEKTGIVVARWEGGALRVEQSAAGSERRPPEEIVLEAMEPNTLIALDAPLGWPESFGTNLAEHLAGEPLPVEARTFFRRETDEFVAKRLGKRPMDVAADRIGRTAFSALEIIRRVREAGWAPGSLAWSPEEARAGVHTIESYPAGRLAATGLPARGYKRREQRPDRERILAALAEELEIISPLEPFLDDADQLDALLCAAGAADFLRGSCIAPHNPRRARKEGWIWVREPLCGTS
ncbi:MAG: DUF429 domain-containing protein [Spirochaetaceae bacterium]